MIHFFMLLLILLPGACGLTQQGSLPPNYKVVLDQSFAKVIRVRYGPHEKVPVHTHPDTPTVYIYLNDGPPVRLTHDETPPLTVVRPPTHKGAFRVSPGMLERHSVENLGDAESDFLRVELPGFRLGDKQLDFRGKPPGDLAHSSSTIEFAAPGLTVVRGICVGPQPCSLSPPAEQPSTALSPSVVVALSTLKLTRGAGSAAPQTMNAGDVVAIPAGERLLIVPAGQSAAHLLQVKIGPPR